MTGYTIDRTDAAAGVLFILFGLFFGIQSLGLDLGTAFRMGPDISRWCWPWSW